ncbi:MAG: beta-L-arabinofuranosidase domain-containing protein, partial [Trebonia sp.]
MREVSRRQAIALLGGGAVLGTQAAFFAHGQPPWRAVWDAEPGSVPRYGLGASGYAPDGTAGGTAAYPLSAVRLLDSPFRASQGRNLNYLLFLDPDRMLHTFRLNYGQPSAARPCGGWEKPHTEVRGHTTGHLLSGLALTYANTGSATARAAGAHLVTELAKLQSLAPAAGYSPGYLSAFPEYFFDWLEAGRYVWSPYYMI